MEKAQVAGKTPIAVELKAGETKYWCACGRSTTQPFCNGAHQGTAFMPVAFTAKKDGPAHFCACKQTGNPPLCDGTHRTL